MNLQEDSSTPGVVARKLSIKDRIKLFSKENENHQSDLVRLSSRNSGASAGSVSSAGANASNNGSQRFSPSSIRKPNSFTVKKYLGDADIDADIKGKDRDSHSHSNSNKIGNKSKKDSESNDSSKPIPSLPTDNNNISTPTNTAAEILMDQKNQMESLPSSSHLTEDNILEKFSPTTSAFPPYSLSPVVPSAPHRKASLSRASEHSTISAISSPNPGIKSPEILRKKIEKVQSLLGQEVPASKQHKKLALKLEQYHSELTSMEDEGKEKEKPKTTQKNPPSPPSPNKNEIALPISIITPTTHQKAPINGVNADKFNSEKFLSSPPLGLRRKDSLSRASDHSVISAIGSPDGMKSPKLLQKKIEKVQILLSHESPESKHHKKLSQKLEQYEAELKELSNNINIDININEQSLSDLDNPQPLKSNSKPKLTRTPVTPKRKSVSLPSRRSTHVNEMNSPKVNNNNASSSNLGGSFSNISSPSPITHATYVKLLKKKIEKVQSLLLKEKDPYNFSKFKVKLEQYQKELVDLQKSNESTSASSSSASATDCKQSLSRRRSVNFDERTTKQPSSALPPPPPPLQPQTPECDHRLLQRKLKKVDKIMGNMVQKLGKKAFSSREFQKLLKKREEYLDALEEAGVKEGKFKVVARDRSIAAQKKEKQKNQASSLDSAFRIELANNGDDKSEEEEKPFTRRESRTIRTKSFMPPPPLSVGTALLNDEPATSSKRISPITEDAPVNFKRRASGPKRKTERVCAPRLQELEGKYVPKYFDKTAADEKIIRAELSKNFIFKKVAQAPLEQLLRSFEVVDTFQKGDPIIQQGDAGDYFYILGKGRIIFEVNGVNVGGTDQVGSSFGELALLYQSPRKATVRANSSDIRVFRVDQVTFRYILQSRSRFLALWKQAVNKVMAMNRLLGLGVVAEQMKATTDEDDGDDNKDDASEGSMDFENEVVKHGDDLRITADDDDDVDSIEEDHELSMYMSELSQRRFSLQSSLTGAISVDSFHRSSVLGEGQFGEVWLVTPKADDIHDEQFALKIQSKEDMGRAAASYSVAEAIERECKVLSELCHPFIVDFVHSFEDDENIYLVMGRIKGQELWNRIHREQDDGEWISGISEADSKFYAILIADTIYYMHRQQICYRDMKPENVMVDHTGYPIIVDFGFAKVIPDDKTYTFCGTPQYTAPEIIANQGHGRAVDNWALGVVIYEMITGENPFYYDGISDLQLLNDISNAEPEPIKDDEVECSKDAKDIIMKLLVKDPAKRLFGKEIISHPWFNSIDINQARKMKISAPWAPVVDDDDDVEL